jgi:PAS domain S-box-containing protein
MTDSPENSKETRPPGKLLAHETQARLEGIIDSAMDAIISIDEEQRIILFNHAAELMFGYKSSKMIGEPLSRLLPERFRSLHQQHVVHFGETRATNRSMGKLGKLYGRRANGEDFPIEAAISQITTENGKIFTVILRDISERVRAEQELLEKEQRLVESAAENARLYELTEKRLQFLSSLRIIDLAIGSSLDVRVTLQILLDQVVSQLNVDAAAILLIKATTQSLEYVEGRGLQLAPLKNDPAESAGCCAGEAAAERKIVWIKDLSARQKDQGVERILKSEGIGSCFAAPLIAKGEVVGVLEVYQRRPYAPVPEWIENFEALAGQAAIAIDSARLFNKLQRSNQKLLAAYDATIQGWSKALDLRDHETENHTQRVTEMTVRLAENTGKFDDEEILNIRWGALLHDIGKVGVPDDILLKNGALSEEEWTKMKEHPLHAYELLVPIDFLRKALDIPRYHHEWWDGKGYPYGLSGDRIPLAARLFTVVDVWDALSNARPYRPAWEAPKVIEYLIHNSGSHFDPQAVDALLKIL